MIMHQHLHVKRLLHDFTGAKDSLELFYCNFAGCAANVVKVFCNDTLLQHDLLPDCSGSPLPHKVCQHDGRAYVSTPVGTKCEFEEESKYISTEKCTGNFTCKVD